LRSAAEFVAVQLELQRRSVRADLIAKVDIHRPDLREMRRLVALDRYERYAHTTRHRASDEVLIEGGPMNLFFRQNERNVERGGCVFF
jgi:hypothetical protein